MRRFFMLALLWVPFTLFAQALPEKEDRVVCYGEELLLQDTVFEMFDVQKPPRFPGGEAELLRFLSQNLYSPQGCEEGVGTIVVQFVIDTLGEAVDWKIIKTPGKCFAPVVVEIFSKMPCWEPGERAGRRVRTRFMLPIRIHWE